MAPGGRLVLFGCLFASPLLILPHGSQNIQETLLCQPGFYCPHGSLAPVPCPKGTYRPITGAVSLDSCLKCPPHHYCPRPGSHAPIPCGPVAQQPLSGKDTCTCRGEGQRFQLSDGQCHCTIGYQPTTNGDMCVQQMYDVCRDGKTRTQHGDCFDKNQWSLHCRQQVCQTAEDYRGYDGELGLCVCREPPGRAACGGLCRSRSAIELKLQCRSSTEMELVWSYASQVLSISGGVLETVFQQWDSQGTLQCNSHLTSSRPVYIVRMSG
ncbi:cell death abnormality protein 1 [Mugil cephalus]|uniref:cell death abnormality protein 1 n=1 Tax=Mugil cephalus TaxID=48193 RepID=UPI001FB69757|nr:cell death abnormality protein 1 [Mugil cephalus]